MAHLPIEQLIEDLKEIFAEQPESDERISNIKSLLGVYVKGGHKDWEKYVYFNDVHYTRNLVELTDNFELMIICWKNGQRSRIHNHAGSHCLMGVVQGKLVEYLYNYITPDGRIVTEHDSPLIVGSVCPDLHFEKQTTLSLGEVSYVSDKLGLHSIHTDGENAISLHLYSPPITNVKILEPETRSISTRKPGFYSKYGVQT